MIPIAGIHIEPTNICTLKCPGCPRTQFIDQWSNHWKNYSVNVDDLMSFLDVDLSRMPIDICGVYGDPIYHPDFIKMISKLKSRSARILITTNGSYKKKEWWESLCELLDHDDMIQFSIDGIPENFTKYRINGDWESIKKGIETCVAGKVKTRWKFIPFSFNQDCIDTAKNLCSSMGMDEFFLEYSDRFDEKTTHLLPVESLVGKRKTLQDSVKNNNSIEVTPRCRSGKEHYISASGHYSPCCFVADHRFYYKTIFGTSKKLFDIRHNRISEILKSGSTQEFFKSLDQTPPKVCQFNCPKV